MARDPLADVIDAPLFIVPRVLAGLRAFRQQPRLANLPGTDTREERARLGARIDALTDRLLAGVEAHPTRFWVLKQFQKTLEAIQGEDTEARDHVAMELEQLMAILGIERSDGLLAYYLGAI